MDPAARISRPLSYDIEVTAKGFRCFCESCNFSFNMAPYVLPASALCYGAD